MFVKPWAISAPERAVVPGARLLVLARPKLDTTFLLPAAARLGAAFLTTFFATFFTGFLTTFLTGFFAAFLGAAELLPPNMTGDAASDDELRCTAAEAGATTNADVLCRADHECARRETRNAEQRVRRETRNAEHG